MKPPLFAGFLAVMICNCAYGSAYLYSTNFDVAPWRTVDGVSVGADVNGIDKWTINDSTDQFSQVARSNVNPTDTLNQSRVLNLGGSTTLPPLGNSVVLSHPSGGTVGTTQVIFDFVLIDSTNDSPARNTFGSSISNGTNNIFAITFVPDPLCVGVINPDSTEAKWNAYYQVGAGPTVALNMSVFELSQYRFELSLKPNDGNPLLTDFLLKITSAVPNILSDGATGLALDPTTGANRFNLSWSKDPSGSFGDNSILVDNLTVVPEPSSALLLGLAGLGLAARRRRG